MGQWSYSGAYLPSKMNTLLTNQVTFSLGIFRWITKENPNNGLKKTHVYIRVIGYVSNPDAAIKKAEEICAQLNTGKSVNDFKKRITV